MKNLLKKLATSVKKHKIITTGTLIAIATISVVGAPKLIAEWYPNRPVTFDYNKPCNTTDKDLGDRCGSLTGPVFNSFINTPSYGDERAFTDARRSDQTASGSFKNVLPDVDKGSKEIVVRMYVHNNANQSTNASGKGVAKNTKIRLALPTATASSLRARGYISADNATPEIVSDTVDFTAGQAFSVSYEPGSAVMYNATHPSGAKLSDSIVTTGALIGDNADGKLPGCFEHEIVIQVKLKVNTPGLNIEKLVRKAGTKDWVNSVNVKPGDTVEWLVDVDNTGTSNNTHTTVRDQLPPHLTFNTGSMKWIDTNRPSGDVLPNQTALFTSGGVDFGTYAPGGGMYVLFSTKINNPDDFSQCVTTIRNTAWAKSSENAEKVDQADVVVTKENCNPPTKTPGFEISKDVRKKGDSQWQQDVNVKYGDSVEYRINVKNTGETDLKNVVVKDNQPTGVQYVAGSLKVNSQANNGDLFGSGVTVPEIKVGGTAEVTFEAKVTAVKPDKCEAAKFHNIASAKPEGLEQKQDDANVNAECEQPQPIYECSALEAVALGNRTYRYTVKYVAKNGASLNVVRYDFGDKSNVLTTNKTTVDHKYATPGEYTTTATLIFNVGNTQKEARCSVKVTVPKNPCKYNPSIPEDSDKCVPPRDCTTNPEDKKCQTTPAPVTVVPSTGGGMASGVIGSGATVYALYAWVESKRALKRNR